MLQIDLIRDVFVAIQVIRDQDFGFNLAGDVAHQVNDFIGEFTDNQVQTQQIIVGVIHHP
jgi:hypothetical protein